MTQLTTEDKAFIQIGSTMAVAAYGENPPAGNWKLIEDPRFQTIDKDSGFMARVYVNADTKQVWVAVAGTNGSSDVLAYPNAYIGWSTNTVNSPDSCRQP